MTESKDKPASVEEPDWRQLFHDPVIEVKHSSKGYANDVWIVSTEISTWQLLK